jgi:hypothetical protein
MFCILIFKFSKANSSYNLDCLLLTIEIDIFEIHDSVISKFNFSFQYIHIST